MLVSSAEAYRLWASTYDSSPNALLVLESRLFSEFVATTTYGTVLDIGCGTGRLMSRYANVRTQVFGAALPFDDGVADLTVCSFGISYFLDLGSALSEMARVTKQSGKVVLSDLHPAAWARGWSRSFRVGDASYHIEHTVRSDREFSSALGHADLEEVQQIDAAFSERERSLFVAAGREHLFVEAANTPAVRVGIYSKR